VTVEGDSLGPGELELLARMHCEALPESLVTRIGPRYARAFYRYIASSEYELVMLHREQGEITAACIVSLEPETMSRRLVLHTPLAFHAPFALFRLPVGAMVARTRGDQPRGAEILLIFTLASARSRGLGAQLVERCQKLVRSHGIARVLVKTRDDPANRAIGFYERAGFKPLGKVEKFGKALLLLSRE
jgi:ribosomal protein S18 acetylase RimI-like enzyme